MKFSITKQDPQSVILDAILTNAFNSLATYTGWPISHINEILERYTPYDNMDHLGDLILDFLRGKPTKGSTLDFYLNTDDMLLMDAIPSFNPDGETEMENVLWYTEQDKEEYIETFYTDPILGVSFNIFID